MRIILIVTIILSTAAAAYIPVARIRADDIARTLVAQDHLRQLGLALSFYFSDYGDRIDDPIRLWEMGYVSDPIVFWHPGDADPAPTAIDNSVPDNLNSTRISFEFANCVRECTGFNDDPIIWDNTPDNNGGQFITFYAKDGGIETDPPNISPVPTNVAVTRAHLRRLWWAIHVFAMKNGGQAPTDLSDVHPSYFASSPRNYWNPGDSDPMPDEISTNEQDAVNSTQVSFDYLVAGQDWEFMDRETSVLIDNSPNNNSGYGFNVLNRRGFVRFVNIGTFGDANDDGDIDLEDYAKMQRCFTPWPYGAILDHSCRIMDWDGDDRISDWNDRENFLILMTGP